MMNKIFHNKFVAITVSTIVAAAQVVQDQLGKGVGWQTAIRVALIGVGGTLLHMKTFSQNTVDSMLEKKTGV